jgi:hypothetical protein
MVTYAVVGERQVDIKYINYPLVAYQRHQIDGLSKKLV